MFQTHTITPSVSCKPAKPSAVPAPAFWAELLRMLAQMASRH